MATKDKKDEGAQFVKYFGPLLDALRGLGGSAKAEEAVDRVAEDLKLPDAVLNETLPSGGSRFRNQVAWARFYLVREGLIDSSKLGVWSLTEKGFKTTLSLEQSREIFLKWVKLFQEQRKSMEKAEPIAEQVAEGTGGLQTTIAKKFWKPCWLCHRPASRGWPNEFSVSPASLKLS